MIPCPFMPTPKTREPSFPGKSPESLSTPRRNRTSDRRLRRLGTSPCNHSAFGPLLGQGHLGGMRHA